MGLFWLNLLTRSSTTESPLLLLCGLDSVGWMQSLSAYGKDNGGSTTKRKRATMNGVEVALLLLRRFLPRLFLIVCVCAACCCCCLCCCHHSEPAWIFLCFLTDSSLPYNSCASSQMTGSEPSVPATRWKITSPAERTFSSTCTLSTPDLVVSSVWLVVCRAFAVVVVR